MSNSFAIDCVECGKKTLYAMNIPKGTIGPDGNEEFDTKGLCPHCIGDLMVAEITRVMCEKLGIHLANDLYGRVIGDEVEVGGKFSFHSSLLPHDILFQRIGSECNNIQFPQMLTHRTFVFSLYKIESDTHVFDIFICQTYEQLFNNIRRCFLKYLSFPKD